MNATRRLRKQKSVQGYFLISYHCQVCDRLLFYADIVQAMIEIACQDHKCKHLNVIDKGYRSRLVSSQKRLTLDTAMCQTNPLPVS